MRRGQCLNARAGLVRAAVGLVGAAGLAGVAGAQSCGGLQRGGGYIGLGGVVVGAGTVAPPVSKCSVNWDPDGPGPLPEELVVGGFFGSVDGVPATAVAAWDGQHWAAIGGQLFLTSSSAGVTALGVHNGELYAAGQFGLSQGGPVVYQVAHWTGAAWEQVGSTFPTGAVFNCIQSYNGQLWVGGDFFAGGGDLVHLVSGDWQAVTVPGGPGDANTSVWSMATYNSELLVGGNFPSRLYRIGPSGPVGTLGTELGCTTCSLSLDGGIASIVVIGGTLYVGGDVYLQNRMANSLLSWDGQHWHGLGFSPSVTFARRRLFDLNGAVVDGTGVQYLNNGQWVRLETSLRTWAPGGQVTTLQGIGAFGGRLVLGGNFTALSSQLDPGLVAPPLFGALASTGLDGVVRPITQGFGAPVWAFATWQGRTLAAGSFVSVGDEGGISPSPQVPGHIARLRDDGTFGLLDIPLPDQMITAMTEYQGRLVVSSPTNFRAGNISQTSLAAWDGNTWSPMAGPNQNVPSRWLGVAGGTLWSWFNGSSGEVLGRWTGTTWVSPGPGVTNGRPTIFDDQLYVSRSNGTIAKWDGQALASLPNPAGETVMRVLGVYSGQLLGLSSHQLMYRWNGGMWDRVGSGASQTLGPSVRFGNSVEANGVMYLPINRQQTGTTNGVEVLTWDGSSWGSVGQMLTNTPYDNGVSILTFEPPALFKHSESEVWVGGGFLSATFRDPTQSLPSSYFARLATPGRPRTVSAPAALVAAPAGGAAELTWELDADGGSFRWYREGVALSDGARAGVGVVSGSGAATLHIEQLEAAASGQYWCVATGPCGTYTLTPTYLYAAPLCNPDLNNDGVVDGGDVDYLINVIAGGDNPENIGPDFNHDGVADQTDVEALVNAVAGGGCP